MAGDESDRSRVRSEGEDAGSEEPVTAGWDRDAFWVPTLDGRGALLAGVVVLFGLHFNELFGLHVVDTLLFGWLPVNLAYYVGLGVLHVGFLLVLYVHWPDSQFSGASDAGERPR